MKISYIFVLGHWSDKVIKVVGNTIDTLHYFVTCFVNLVD